MSNKKIRKKGLKIRNIIFIILGTISLILGIIGIFIPLLPTTPFLLLTAYLYAKSSQKLYNWLISNKYFGKYIDRYRKGLGVPKKTKILAISTLWFTIITSVVLINKFVIIIILFLIAGAVTYHIVRLPNYIDKEK